MRLRRLFVIGSLFAGLVALLRRGGLHEDLAWEDIDKPGRIIDIDGYAVHYIDEGSGPAIVLIHGLGGHTYHYRRMMAPLARSHRVIAVDLKGYGYSERDANAGLSHSDQVAMVRELLQRLGVERAVFVGHSMGGLIVQRFAATHPEMVEAAVLAASATGDEPRIRWLMPKFLLRPILPYLARMIARAILKASFVDKSYLTDEIRAEYLRPARIRGSMDVFYALIRDVKRDPRIDHARITMPVLLVNAARDRIIPLKSAQRIRDRIPHARLVVIENAAHALIDERAPECTSAILDFLSDTRSSRTEHATAS